MDDYWAGTSKVPSKHSDRSMSPELLLLLLVKVRFDIVGWRRKAGKASRDTLGRCRNGYGDSS